MLDLACQERVHLVVKHLHIRWMAAALVLGLKDMHPLLGPECAPG